MMTIFWIVIIAMGLVYLLCSIFSERKLKLRKKELMDKIRSLEEPYTEEYEANKEDYTCIEDFLCDKHYTQYRQIDKLRDELIFRTPDSFKESEAGIVLGMTTKVLLIMCIFIHILSVMQIHTEYIYTQKSYEYMQEYADTVTDDFLRVGGAEAILEYNDRIAKNQTLQSMWLNKIIYIDNWSSLKPLTISKEVE